MSFRTRDTIHEPRVTSHVFHGGFLMIHDSRFYFTTHALRLTMEDTLCFFLRLTTYLPTAGRRIPKLNSPIPNSFIFNFQFSTLDS